MLEQKDLQAIDELIQKRIGESEARTNQRFEAVDKRFEAMQAQMDQRFEAVDKRFEAIDKRFEAMDKRLDEMKGDIWQNVSVLMDAKFDKLFNLLAENQMILQEKMDQILGEKLPERMEKTEGDVQVLKVAVRRLNEDVGELKAAR